MIEKQFLVFWTKFDNHFWIITEVNKAAGPLEQLLWIRVVWIGNCIEM